MATLSIYKGTALSTTKIPVKDGQLLFETDTKKIWLDNGTTRLQVGGQDSIAWDKITGKPSTFTPSSHTHSYLNLTGGTLTGSLQIGNSSTSATTADPVGIVVRDLRAVTMTPDTLGDRTAIFYFDEAGPSGDNSWKGILRVKGWTGSYAAWELAGPGNTTIKKKFYVRCGVNDTWEDWQELLTSSSSITWDSITNKPSSYTPSSHTHNYAGSSSAGGAANSSNTLKINNTASLSDCLQYIQTSSQTTGNDLPTEAWWHVLKMNHGTGDTYYKRLLAFNFFDNSIKTAYASGNGVVNAWKKVWIEGDSVTGAVWNDYAEYRESTTTKPGLVVFENGDDTLSPTTERLSHFAGIVSDTWGFCQGETERAKTPIAVAGRVLAYTYQERNKYQPGDCVCAAPGGTVDIMTREEVERYPDRIVGTVSCVPDYEEWGQGDRPAVKVDGRIWIKVK